MTVGVSIAATGSALAFLLFENSNSRNNQAGFLFGDVVSEKKNLISDSDYGEETTETVIHVHAVAQDPSLSSTYSLKDCDFFKKDGFPKSKEFQNVVGWYSFKRNVTAVPTLKDRVLHKQMLTEFQGNPERFLFCLLTSSENSDNMSHSFKQHFLVLNPTTRKYEAIPLLIENLANVSPQYRVPLPPTGEELLRELIDARWTSEELIVNLRGRLGDQLREAVFNLVQSEKRISEAQEKLSRIAQERDELLRRVREKMEREDELRKAAQKEEEEARAARLSEGDRKMQDGGGGGAGDSNANRYPGRRTRPRSHLRGVLGLPPAMAQNQWPPQGRALNPRLPNCDNKSPYW